MASGKTSVGEVLAKQLQVPHIDLDLEIEKAAQMTIPEIFERKGEIYFRKMEHRLFVELLREPRPFVLSLGGGTPCYSNNHELLQSDGISSFYLKASVPTLVERLSVAGQNRPLIELNGADALTEFIAKHLFDRSYYYNHATHIVSVDGKSVEDIASEIRAALA